MSKLTHLLYNDVRSSDYELHVEIIIAGIYIIGRTFRLVLKYLILFFKKTQAWSGAARVYPCVPKSLYSFRHGYFDQNPHSPKSRFYGYHEPITHNLFGQNKERTVPNVEFMQGHSRFLGRGKVRRIQSLRIDDQDAVFREKAPQNTHRHFY